MKRYLKTSGLKLGLIVNFHDKYIKLRRALNSKSSFVDSDKFVVSHRSGFTLVEVLITVTIVSVVIVAGFMGVSKYYSSRNLDLTLNEITTVMREVQRRSVTQQDGKRWGIRFEKTSGRDTFYIFKGTSFASGTIAKTTTLRRGIEFGEPTATSTYDLIFLPIEGTISPKKIITIRTKVGENPIGDVIVNFIGKVVMRFETGLVGYWHFDEGTSTIAYDATPYENNGALTNGPTWQTGTSCKAGECLSFDGDNDYINLTNSTPSGTKTFTAWVKLNNFTGDQNAIFGNYIAQVNTNAKLAHYNGSDYLYSSSTLTADVWHHVAYVFNETADSLTFYINGSESGVRSSPDFSTTTIYLGVYSAGGSFPFDGYIDEVRIYNRALSADEVLNLYNDLR